MICLKKCILFLLLVFLHGICSGQAYKYRFRMINLPEEFKNQYISLVDEDAAGMLWFVTNSGLHRYDGNQVLNFDMQSTPSLPDADIHLLLADRQNRLWIATRSHLVCFNLQQWSTRFIPYKHAPSVLQEIAVTALGEGKDGTVYVGSNNTLYRIANDSLEMVTHIEKEASAAATDISIFGIHEPVPGHLLLNLSNGNIVSIKHQQKIFAQPAYVKLLPARASVQSPNATPALTYVTNVVGKGPYMVDMQQLSAVPLANIMLPQNPDNYDLTANEIGVNEAIIFYTDRKASETGMMIYDAEQNTFEDFSAVYPTALKIIKMRAMGYKNGHVLIPCKGGIATISYTSSAFDVFGASLENTNSIRSIYKEPGGNLFVGSYTLNFVKFDEATSAVTSRSGDLISCILPWQKDTLLVGSEGAGLGWYLPASDRHIKIFGHGPDAPMDPNIICLIRESDTSFWAGTGKGFYLLNPHTNRILKSSATEPGRPLQESVVYDILKVGRYVFFGTRSGLFKYDAQSKRWTKLLTTTIGNYADSYFSCLRLANNQIWAGTVGNGMLVLDTNGNFLRKITTAEGLAGNIIFSNPLCKNHLFVGTRTGLSVIDVLSGKISNYSSEYYLPANEFNRSAWCVNGDTVYMGTINGIIRVDIKRLQQQENRVAPGVCFSSFTTSNGGRSHSDFTLPYRKDVALTIPPDVSNFSIGFGGLSEMAGGLKLYYRLDADGPWQEIGQRREVTFINISPDDYTMQIAALLPDGKWMENMLTLPITVQPHFYQTWWWKTLLFAIALGLIWLGIKYRERELRKEEQLRSRIAGDLHDEVGSALTRIYFQAGMLNTNEGEPTEPTAALQQIASSSQEALSSMSDMVWSIDSHYDNALDMVDRIRDYLARLHDELDSRCTFNVTGNYERLRLSQVLRQNILLIFKEAMNNALKYGHNKTVAVNLFLNESTLKLEIINQLPLAVHAENGVQGGHGMKSMQLRADKIKGKLSVTHTSDTFTVQLVAKPF